MELSRFSKVIFGALAVSAATPHAHATPCIEPVDLVTLFEWGQLAPAAVFSVQPYRMAFDAATGETHAFGMAGVDGGNVVRAFKWDGFEWIARDTGPLTSQFGGVAAGNITGLALDPVSRVAVLLTRSANSLDFAYAFNIDDFSAPLIPLGFLPDPGAAARSQFVTFASDEGAFYFFNAVTGVLRFDAQTGVITPTGAPANTLFPNLEGECVYDLDERRVVFFESVQAVPRTFVYSLDANAIVETTDPATAPPGQNAAFHRLVANSSNGEVFVVAFRNNGMSVLPTHTLYRLSGEGDWLITDTFTLPGAPIFQGAPAAAFDERAGQILLGGGWFNDQALDYATRAIRFEAPQFAAPPASISVPQGQPATLVALPSANSLYSSVVWRKNGQVLTATGIPAFMIPSASASDAGVYTAEMVGFCGNSLSQEFTLTVICSGDTDANGTINFSDLNAVLSRFGQICD